MIIGIGSDIVQIPRIAGLIERFGQRFLNRIYTPQEQEGAKKYHHNQLLHGYYAKRFAAKEAAAKALGIAIRDGICFTDFSLTNNAYGKPLLSLTGKALAYLQGVSCNPHIFVSLSDDYPAALAMVVIEERIS